MDNELKDIIYDKFEKLVEQSSIINSNALMIYDVVTSGTFPADNYEWTFSDLSSKAYALNEEIRSTYEQLIEVMKRPA